MWNRSRLENQLEQGDDHNQANQEDDADGAAEELEHCYLHIFSSQGWDRGV